MLRRHSLENGAPHWEARYLACFNPEYIYKVELLTYLTGNGEQNDTLFMITFVS